MNRLYFLLAVLMFAACQKSPQQKAEALIKDSMKKTLYHPESYVAVETKLDSAFAPFDSPEFYEKTLKVAKYSAEIEQAKEEMNRAKSNMSLWSGPYQSAFGANEYREAKEKYDENNEKKEVATEKAQKLAEKMKTEIQKGPVFIGFKARHKYKANNNAGNTLFGECEVLFDKELTQIIARYDTDGGEYALVHQLYKMMMGEDD